MNIPNLNLAELDALEEKLKSYLDATPAPRKIFRFMEYAIYGLSAYSIFVLLLGIVLLFVY